jgi:hypothetical protein
MTKILLEVAAHALHPAERAAVLGDLSEAGKSGWSGVLEVLGLVIRRQADQWRDWQPWAAAFGLALPGSFALMGISVSIRLGYQRVAGVGTLDLTSLTTLVCQIVLLVAGAWTGGFVVGSISRRTLGVSAALCASPCLFCLSRFHIGSLSRLSLLLFLLPALLGVLHALRRGRVRLEVAGAIAAATTLVMVMSWTGKGLWILHAALLWPSWYLVATTRSRETA